MTDAPAVFAGLKLYEVLTLVGIVIGPIAAVIITLAFEFVRRRRDQQMQVFRMLINTRHLPGDPSWSVAVNMVPVEFNRNKQVMAAWAAYMALVRYEPTPENRAAHESKMVAKQATLIFEIGKTLGFRFSETDIQTEAYISKGFIARDNAYLDSLLAMRDIANAMKRQQEMLEAQIKIAQAQRAESQ